MHCRDGAASGTWSSASRRDFLKAASAAAIGAACGAMSYDPEKLLWVPGSRSFFEIHRPVRILQEGWHNVLKGELVTTEDFPKKWTRALDDGAIQAVKIERTHLFWGRGVITHCPCNHTWPSDGDAQTP